MLQDLAVPYLTVPREQIGIHPPAFRLPAATHIRRVALQVADLDRSLGFYEGVIGFRVLDREAGKARLGTHGEEAVLLELVEKKGVRPVPQRGLLGLYHFAVLLPTRGDLGRFILQAASQGVRFGAADHAYSEATYLVDPDGLTVEVYRDLPREDWLVRDGEILGTTETLDARGVTAAAGNEPWRGLPPGTVIGHVHHYIGDIEQAAAFYHRALGFDKVGWSWGSTALFVSAGGYHHHVGLNTWAAGSPVATDDDAKLLHWELALPDAQAVEAAARSVEQGGYRVVRASEGVYASDPWGITVLLAA
jgi:catechol 2,3-dioxygenase